MSTVGEADDTQMAINNLSPDGKTVAVQRLVNGNPDVWLIDVERGVPRRLTVAQGFDGAVVFSPDGRRIAYMSDAAADVFDTLYERAADVLATARSCSSSALSPITTPRTGRGMVNSSSTSRSPETQSDLWALPLTGSRQPIEIRENPVRRDGWAVLAGRTVDRVLSNEAGPPQIFCSTLPRPGTEPAGVVRRWSDAAVAA